MRVRHKANVVISDDTEGKNKLLALDDALSEVILDGCTEHSSGNTALDADDMFTVPLGAIGEVRGLFLKASGDFTVSFSGGAAIAVKCGPTGTGDAVATTARILMDAQVTSIVVDATEALTLIYAVWGDPIP